MHSPARRLAAALCLALLLTACATKQATRPTPGDGPGTGAAAPPPATPEQPAATSPTLQPGDPGTAAWLFPGTHQQLTFTLTDLNQKPQQVSETLIAGGDEVVATQGGTPYAAWFLKNDGVWRRDPKGPDLLRYLPAKLTGGETWQQQSGDAKVSFALHRGEQCPAPASHTVHVGECWTLTVLNRGERTVYQFAAGLGPVAALSANYAQPAASYYKVMTDAQPATPSQSDIMTAKEKAPRATGGVPHPITALTPAAFDAVLDTFPQVQSKQVALLGDGQNLRLRGVFDAWTLAPGEIFSADGTRLGSIEPPSGEAQFVRLLALPTGKQPLLLQQWQFSVGLPFVTAYTLHSGNQGLRLEQLCCWGDVKSPSTLATRVDVRADGTLIVAWDMGDPARHTRVRTYQISDSQGIRMTAENVKPQGQELHYPSDPLGVLTAAFDAYWLELPDELPRYFATPATLHDFQAYLGQKKVAKPEQHYPVDVSFATLTKQGERCSLQFAPASLSPDNAAPFSAGWGGYEWGAAAWGTVTFGQDAQGRPVIAQVKFQDTCASFE